MSDKSMRQAVFLKHFIDSWFNITESCRLSMITRATFYNWLKDKSFAELFDKVKKDALLLMETRLYKSILEGDIRTIMFYLKYAKRFQLDK